MEVLVPIDGTESTRETVEHAVSEYPDASITVLHVLTVNAVYGTQGVSVHRLAIEAQERYAEDLFEAATETAEAHGSSVTMATEIGSPVRAIVAYAEEADVDHVVIGSCDRGVLLRLLFGDVTKGVVRRASVPVTVVN